MANGLDEKSRENIIQRFAMAVSATTRTARLHRRPKESSNEQRYPARAPACHQDRLGSTLAFIVAPAIDSPFDDLEPAVLMLFLVVLNALGLSLTYLARGGSKSRWCMVIIAICLFAAGLNSGIKTGEWHDVENLAMDVLLLATVISLCLPAASRWYRDTRDLREDFLVECPADYAVLHRRRVVPPTPSIRQP